MLPHIQSGRLKAYAVTSAKRIDSLPDVPTMREAGVPGYEATQWYAVAVPSGTPPERLAQLNQWINQAIQSPELRPTLRTISRSAAPLGAAGEGLRPVAKCLNQNIIPILYGVVPDGEHTTNLKVYEELGGTFTGLGASTPNFDSNGPWVRYLLGFGNQLLSTSDGGTTLTATAERPVIGSTPAPVSAPPLRPDVACETQSVPSLETKMKPFQGTTKAADIDKEQVTEVLDRGLRTIDGLDKKGQDLKELQRQLRNLLGTDRGAGR